MRGARRLARKMERVAYVNTVFATFYGFMSPATCPAAVSSATHVSSSGILFSVVNQLKHFPQF